MNKNTINKALEERYKVLYGGVASKVLLIYFKDWQTSVSATKEYLEEDLKKVKLRLKKLGRDGKLEEKKENIEQQLEKKSYNLPIVYDYYSIFLKLGYLDKKHIRKIITKRKKKQTYLQKKPYYKTNLNPFLEYFEDRYIKNSIAEDNTPKIEAKKASDLYKLETKRFLELYLELPFIRELILKIMKEREVNIFEALTISIEETLFNQFLTYCLSLKLQSGMEVIRFYPEIYYLLDLDPNPDSFLEVPKDSIKRAVLNFIRGKPYFSEELKKSAKEFRGKILNDINGESHSDFNFEETLTNFEKWFKEKQNKRTLYYYISKNQQKIVYHTLPFEDNIIFFLSSLNDYYFTLVLIDWIGNYTFKRDVVLQLKENLRYYLNKIYDPNVSEHVHLLGFWETEAPYDRFCTRITNYLNDKNIFEKKRKKHVKKNFDKIRGIIIKQIIDQYLGKIESLLHTINTIEKVEFNDTISLSPIINLNNKNYYILKNKTKLYNELLKSGELYCEKYTAKSYFKHRESREKFNQDIAEG